MGGNGMDGWVGALFWRQRRGGEGGVNGWSDKEGRKGREAVVVKCEVRPWVI